MIFPVAKEKLSSARLAGPIATSLGLTPLFIGDSRAAMKIICSVIESNVTGVAILPNARVYALIP
nr:hypothetical protein [Candidatus Nitrosocosmicus arcticus]